MMKYCLKCCFVCLILLSAPVYLYSQDNDYRLGFKAESVGTFSDGDFAPFWITNNNYGIGSESNNKGYLRVGSFFGKKFFGNKLDMSVGADVIVSNNMQSDFYFQQLHADFKYRSVGLSVGVKERNNPHRNNDLSTGGLTLSNNARPIPQVEAGFHDFVEVPFTNGFLHIQGAISYGRFLDDKYKRQHAGENNKYAEDVLYHRKYAYFKVEKNTPWNFILGLEMDTQWGGKFYENRLNENGYYGKSSAKLKDFFKAFIPMSGGSNSHATDAVNISGNVYGSWHFIYNYQWKDYSIRAYHEHFFEDHSGMWLKNIPDGTYGVEFNWNKKQLLSSVLLEWVHTKNQSGPFLFDKTENIPIQVSAGDNYYNHVDYVSIANYGFVMGNPLLTSPIYNNGRTLYVLNSRITAFHGGIAGYFTDELKYRALATYSKSWGTCFIPSKSVRNQFSGMIEVNYMPVKLTGWTFAGALAYDNSATMVGDNVGFQLKIAKAFDVK